jgi:hypothetical protein
MGNIIPRKLCFYLNMIWPGSASVDTAFAHEIAVVKDLLDESDRGNTVVARLDARHDVAIAQIDAAQGR